MSIQRKFRQLLCGHCILVILGLLTLVACQQDRPQAPPRSPLRVGWHTWPGYFPIAIAVHLNLFAKHGVTVEPILYESAVSSHPDLQAGKLDGATGTLADALLMDGRLPDNVRVVLVADYSAGGDVVVATADIATVADLRGKRVGARLGSFSELFVLTTLQMHGLTKDDVTLLKVEPQDVPTAIPDVIQAGHTWEPGISQALAQGYHILFSSTDTPGLIPDLVIFRTHVIKTRPDDIRAFIATDLSTTLPALAQRLGTTTRDKPYFTTRLIETGEVVLSAAVATLETQPWVVVFAQPQAVFLATTKAQMWHTLILAMLIAAVVSGDEIGALAAAFNSMTRQLRDMMVGLQQRIAERTQAEQIAQAYATRLHMLANLSQLISSSLHADHVLDEIAKAAAQLMEAPFVCFWSLTKPHRRWKYAPFPMTG